MGKKQKFIDELIRIADDNSHGYDQTHRNGPDYDCSQLIYHCAGVAGYNIPAAGTTSTLRNDFIKAGWTCLEYDGNPYDLEAGDVILREGKHVEAALSSSEWIGAHINEKGTITGGKTGDQTGNEIGRCKPYHYGEYPNDWDWVLVPPDENTGSGVIKQKNLDYTPEVTALLQQAVKLLQQALNYLK